MTIKVGDRFPAAEFLTMTADGKQIFTTDMVFSGRRVVLFAVPGAFTPTCSRNHFPGFVEQAEVIKAKGVHTIACTAVNDVHVMAAWGRANGADGRILMLADGNGDFARAIGMINDLRASGMGERSRRYSMIVDNGVVTTLNVESQPGVNISGAATILAQL
jgi:peroxiredoxin